MAIGKVIKGDVGGDAAVERAAPLGRPAGRVLNADEFEASQAAKSILENARREADAIRELGRVDAEAALTRSRDEGRAQGMASVATELAKAKIQAGELLQQHEPQILELALKMAEKIIGIDVQRDPKLLAQMCATAVETVRNVKAMVIRVNPAMGARMRDSQTLASVFGRLVDITVKDDPEVEVAGCIIQTEFGTIDAQLTTQIEMLKTALMPDNAKKDGPV